MRYIGVDLGSTNMKAAIYDENLSCLTSASAGVEYDRSGGFVEFDAELYFDSLCDMLGKLPRDAEVKAVGFTGQAESLVVLGSDGRPLMNAISWMDERSKEECAQLTQQFSPEECQSVTGQQAVLPTWPATKILWLQKHRPEVFKNAAKYVLLKDYIIYRLTGVLAADCSIATFSFYFDIYNKRYWKKMLSAIGIDENRLPPLAEPCSKAGVLTAEAQKKTGLSASVEVNIGTLDHFAGMIGTGNTAPGGVSLSTGTVMALATLAREPVTDHCCGIAMHYGFMPDTHVMLPVAESGGASLEWFRKTCMPEVDYYALNETLQTRRLPGDLLFLPYIVGVNAPEFDSKASGLFYGLRSHHDAFDMAAAVMEGVAFLLKKNCDAIRKAGTDIEYIIATGGGAKSELWCQLQADITGLPVVIPMEKEAACLGAAMAAAVGAGSFASFEEAAKKAVAMQRRFQPRRLAEYDRKYRQFQLLYRAALEAAEC